MTLKLNARTKLLLCTTLASVGFVPMQALAQAANGNQLADIVVTAQKREQSVQDVPIAVTALTSASLANNRVVTVTDLSGLAPGVSARPAAGGSQIASFSMRGVTSYGVVPGSDKEVSIYLDGVYISTPRGSIFSLPDASGIEVLRGPQGTLFGRNATAGAVSVTTRDPNGKVGAIGEVTLGNYDQFRMRLTVSTPEIGPFSAYGTYVHDYKRGDEKNLGAGIIWDRTLSPSEQGKKVASADYLGTKKAESYFIAVKFQPTDNFKVVYKHDHDSENGTPDAVGVNYSVLAGNALATALASNPLYTNVSGKRPDAVYNGYSIPNVERVFGHSVTATWDASDNLTVKNIFAFRKTYMFAAVALDGLGGIPVANIGGNTYYSGVYVTEPETLSRQWSDELQINYRTSPVTLTAGAMWFHGIDRTGAPTGFTNSPAGPTFVNAVHPLGVNSDSNNDGKSLAAYAQAEIHATSKLDIVLGGRITKDNKSGSLTAYNGLTQTAYIPFTYAKTKPNWLVGVNYKPSDDIMVYAKASTAFVSGGSVAGITFEPESALSYEAGVKAEWFDRHLRTNLAVYTVKYDNLQTAQGATNFQAALAAAGAALNPPVANLGAIVSTFVVPIGGPVHAKGIELEVTGLLGHGMTVGGSLSYNDTNYSTVDPRILASTQLFAGGPTEYLPGSLEPDWTGSLWGEYQSKPFANGTSISARVDANWHNKFLLTANPDTVAPAFQPYNWAPAAWIVNGRIALKDINIGGVGAEVAIWGKNLTQNRDTTYQLNLRAVLAANYQAARTLGVDLKIHY